MARAVQVPAVECQFGDSFLNLWLNGRPILFMLTRSSGIAENETPTYVVTFGSATVAAMPGCVHGSIVAGCECHFMPILNEQVVTLW